MRKKLLTDDQLYMAYFLALCALIGGRLLYVYEAWSTFEHYTDLLFIWSGGLSVIDAP